MDSSQELCHCGAERYHQWLPTSQCYGPIDNTTDDTPNDTTKDRPGSPDLFFSQTETELTVSQKQTTVVQSSIQSGSPDQPCSSPQQVPGYRQWYNIKYQDDDAVYTYQLMKDYREGNLRIVPSL